MADEQDMVVDPARAAAVKEWNARVDSAKARWDQDFQRMRDNMRFATGRQWDKQAVIQDERYVCNITLKQIRQKVATLYAKNPKAESVRRERLDYMLWDGDAQSLLSAMQTKAQMNSVGLVDPESEAILQDFMQGQQQRDMVKRVGRTLEILYQYQVDASRPNFKRQMKKLVTRTITCGVGYVRLSFVRNDESPVSEDQVGNSPVDRMKLAASLAEEMTEDGLDESASEGETLKMIGSSMGVDMEENHDLPERIEFDFLPSTSVIPDERCRSLQDFVGARFVCIEYNLPIDEIETMFGKDIKACANVEVVPQESKKPQERSEAKKENGIVREILDFRSKNHFYIIKGYEDYLRDPEPLNPSISGFWPLFALTFNDIEVGIEEDDVSIFPPSDVDLVRHPQKEWNRSRHALRDLRNACSPKWMTRKGALSKSDLRKITDAEPNEVVELESVSADAKLNEILAPIPVQKPDMAVFETDSLSQDMTLGGGMQEANIGAAPENVTATGVSVAEQSRMTVSASNVDDLDEFLSSLAQGAGQMSLSRFGFSEETVKRICGPGAVWPTQARADFANQIYLTTKAGSSGRPNKAMEVSNYNLIAPQLINAGANPLGVIEEGVKRLDDQLEISKFLPIGGLGGPSAAPAGPQAAPGQQLQNGAPGPAV